MKIIKGLTFFAALVLSLCFTAIAASAASDLSSSKLYKPLTRISLSAPADSAGSCTLRIDLPDSGRLVFYSDKFNVSDSATYSIIGSKGTELLKTSLSSLPRKTLKFKSGGTYYLKLTLAAGDKIENLLYTYSADDATNEIHGVSLRTNETLSTSKFTKDIKSGFKWIVSNYSVATVKNGQICALKPGKATIEAYSERGDHVKITVYVSDSVSSGIEINGSNMIWVGESFKYSYRYTDGQTHPDHDVVWTLTGKGAMDKNGNLTAIAKGDAVLGITDKTAGISSYMTVHFIKSVEDVDFVTTINGIQIANKTYPIPADYDPGLDNATLAAYNRLAADAAKEGLSFNIISSYRSYQKQVQTYNHWVSLYGKEEADRCSARPGFSEHQLGLAIDVNSCYTSFANTKEGKWLAKNCWKYGFILRYPSVAAEKITGYMYEPWHIRYVGTDLAKTLYESGQTLEEYLGINSYYRQ